MVSYAKLMEGMAGYFPSIPPTHYAKFPVSLAGKKDRELPAGLSRIDFNFLRSRGALFDHDKGLVSAGLVLGPKSNKYPPEMMTDRKNRDPSTMVFWDSGGFQLRSNVMEYHGDKTCGRILSASEHFADVTATVDIPPIPNENPIFDSFDKCLDISMSNNDYYLKNRKYGPKPLVLTVLHGNDRDQCDQWYARAKIYPNEGWAFGTIYKRQLSELLYRLVIICDEHMMDGRSHIHLFGTNRLALTCALTTVQSVLSKQLGRPITVTYDTSSPFTNSYRSRLAYLGYAVDKSGLAMRQHRFPNGDSSANWDRLPFPTIFPSAMANKLKLSDVCLSGKSIFAQSTWDNLSYHLIANHNVEVLLNAIIGAHRIYLMDESYAAGLCPDWLIRTRIGIEEVLAGPNPMTALAKYKSDFDMVRSGGRCMGSDDYEDYADANRG